MIPTARSAERCSRLDSAGQFGSERLNGGQRTVQTHKHMRTRETRRPKITTSCNQKQVGWRDSDQRSNLETASHDLRQEHMTHGARRGAPVRHLCNCRLMKQDVWESVESTNDVFICACVCFPFFQEVAEPLQDLKEGMEQLEKNKTLRYILSTLLSIGNFLNGTNVSHDQCGLLYSFTLHVLLE